jgi:hypothetical protein
MLGLSEPRQYQFDACHLVSHDLGWGSAAYLCAIIWAAFGRATGARERASVVFCRRASIAFWVGVVDLSVDLFLNADRLNIDRWPSRWRDEDLSRFEFGGGGNIGPAGAEIDP